MVDILDKHGLQEEGLFRISGSAEKTAELKTRCDLGKPVDASAGEDVEDVASLLKMFLRELPQAIIPDPQRVEISRCFRESTDELTLNHVLREQLTSLPEDNYNILSYLCHFLLKVASYSQVNQMPVENLATVFGPCLFQVPFGPSMLEEQTLCNTVVCHILRNESFLMSSGLDSTSPPPALTALSDPEDTLKPAFTVSNLPGTTSGSAPATSSSMQASSSASFTITNCMASNPAPSTGPAPTSSSSISSSANGTVLKTSSSAGLVQLPSGFTFVSSTPVPFGAPALPLTQPPQGSSFSVATAQPAPAQSDIFRFPATVSLTGAGVPQQLQVIQVPLPAQQGSVSSSDSSSGTPQASSASAASVPATIVTSSVPSSIGAQMVYPSPHTVMYASAPSLADGGLAVLNALSQTPAAMQVSHTQGPDAGAVPQVFLTAPPGTVQFPVSAVQLHPMVIGQQASGGDSNNLTELRCQPGLRPIHQG